MHERYLLIYSKRTILLGTGFVKLSRVSMSRPVGSIRSDLNYGILHKMGRWVIKNKGAKMASQDLDRQAIHISSDLEDFFDSYNI